MTICNKPYLERKKRMRNLAISGFLSVLVGLAVNTKIYSQELVQNSGMENSEGWTVYNLGSGNPAAYEFNYLADGPAEGENGCLRITSAKQTDILFWQELTLKAGKSYRVDGAIKTNAVQSFWGELYLSRIKPVEGQGYTPNNNSDVVLGLSTWEGCGPNVDGLFSEVACTGSGAVYVPSGTPGEEVTIYFGFKTGIWSDMASPMEVLVDQLSVAMVEDWLLLATGSGVIDNDNFILTQVSPLITVAEFKSGLGAASTASVEIVDKETKSVIGNQAAASVSEDMLVRVQGNETVFYEIELREVSAENNLLNALSGTIDNENLIVRDLPPNARVIQLKTSLVVSAFATHKVTKSGGGDPSNIAFLSDELVIEVTAENGDVKVYAVETGGENMAVETIAAAQDTVDTIRDKLLSLEGNATYHIMAGQNPLPGTIIDLKSPDAWVYFDHILPSELRDNYLTQIFIQGSNALPDVNMRIVRFLNGSAVAAQGADFQPLEIFSEEGFSGSAKKLEMYNYYRRSELEGLAVKSFRLKKGYMATFARNEDGTGYSRVFIADQEDLEIEKVPAGLYGAASFIRVFPWRWTTKKGWTSGKESAEILNCSWQYDWDNAATSSLDVEYVPMRHNKHWNSYNNINNKKNSVHVLGFNEPDKEDQANMTVDEALAQWPELLRSGLRLGSPCPSDGGLNWLYEFMDRCDEMNYRVDFVAVHWYKGGHSPRQYYDWLKGIHDRTKRPIWITEWNNGANWTCCKPTYEEQAEAIEGFLYMLDTTSFVERYSLYEWVEDTRFMFYGGTTNLTPAGEIYRDKISPMAYNPDWEYVMPYIPQMMAAHSPEPGNNTANIAVDTVLSWTSGNPGIENITYEVYFGESDPPSYAAAVNAATFQPPALKPNTTYYWKINATSEYGEIAGPVWSFTTAAADEVEPPLSVRPDQQGGIKVYPNPATDWLVIEGAAPNAIAELYSMMGKRIRRAEIKGGVDVADLPAGIYFLRIENAASVVFLKK